LGSDTAYWSAADQAKLATAAAFRGAEFRRTRQILLDPARAAVTLIARGRTAAQAADELPLVRTYARPVAGEHAARWIPRRSKICWVQARRSIDCHSQAVIHRIHRGGVWRDYARSSRHRDLAPGLRGRYRR